MEHKMINELFLLLLVIAPLGVGFIQPPSFNPYALQCNKELGTLIHTKDITYNCIHFNGSPPSIYIN